MSAFLVGKDTIDKIITSLDFELRTSVYLQEKMKNLTGIVYGDDNWKNDLGYLMLNMNQAALSERYNDKSIIHQYSYYPKLASQVQYLKSLQCFAYQCCEGRIPETGLYKFFDQVFERLLMSQIIYRLPEYDKAMWA